MLFNLICSFCEVGDVSELVGVLSAAELLDLDILNSKLPSFVSSNGIVQCNSNSTSEFSQIRCEDVSKYGGFPPFGLRAYEANTQGRELFW